MTSGVVIDKLCQSYGQSRTLWDIDIEIPEAGCFCLMGRNGVGKTTLLKTLMGILPVESGSIKAWGTDLTRKGADARARAGIGYVPQGRHIFPQLSVEENLRVPLGVRRPASKGIPEQIYTWFPVLKEMRNRRGGDLSGGQQQQLAIGRAMILEPRMLVLDEPTEGIQPNIVAEIGALIRQLIADLDLAVLLVEQKLPFARKVADRFCILDRGRRVADGPMNALTDEVVAQYLVV